MNIYIHSSPRCIVYIITPNCKRCVQLNIAYQSRAFFFIRKFNFEMQFFFAKYYEIYFTKNGESKK